MTDFNIEDFQTFDIQKRRQELANPPVSQAVLDSRAQIVKGAEDYNKLNQFVALATGRRAGSPMEIPSYSDGPTASQSTAANEATLTEFMRSLEKMQEQLGRPIRESEIPAIAKAFNIGPKGLAQIKAYFPYIGRTEAQDIAARGEERTEIRFTQEQEEKTAKQKEDEKYDLLVREASRKLRGVQDGEGFTTEDGSQITPLDPGQTFAAQQEIFNRGMKQAEMMGLDPDEFAKRFNNLIVKAPTTKQVVDAQTGKLVFRSDREIANERDRYIPIQTDSGKLSIQAQNAAIVAFGELGMTYPEGLKLVRLMEDLTPLVAMEQYPEKAPFIMKILTTMQTHKDLIDIMMGRAFKNSDSELKFE